MVVFLPPLCNNGYMTKTSTPQTIVIEDRAIVVNPELLQMTVDANRALIARASRARLRAEATGRDTAAHDMNLAVYGRRLAEALTYLKAAKQTAALSTAADVEDARGFLDNWEHYTGHAGFIAEVGGQAVFDAEYTRRFRVFDTLNSTLSSPDEIAAALVTLAQLRSAN